MRTPTTPSAGTLTTLSGTGHARGEPNEVDIDHVEVRERACPPRRQGVRQRGRQTRHRAPRVRRLRRRRLERASNPARVAFGHARNDDRFCAHTTARPVRHAVPRGRPSRWRVSSPRASRSGSCGAAGFVIHQPEECAVSVFTRFGTPPSHGHSAQRVSPSPGLGTRRAGAA